MACRNHTESSADGRCKGCAEAFCTNCLVAINGEQYCGECKVMGLDGPIQVEGLITVHPLAKDAFKVALFSIFCFGIILGPVAVVKGLQARKEIKADPQLTGYGKATAAVVLGSSTFFLYTINILARVSGMGGNL